MTTIHTVPRNDIVEHDTSTNEPDCVCGPTVNAVPQPDGSMGWQIIHHSLDGREHTEKGNP